MSRRRNGPEQERAIQEVLVQLFAALLCSGKSNAELRAFAISCVRTAEKETKSRSLVRGDTDAQDFGSILRTWHRSGKYLSSDGFPRSLRIEGKNGLRALVGQYFPQSRDSTLSALRAAGLIKEVRKGYWLPTAKHAVFPLLNAELLNHLAEGVSRLVETVISNVTTQQKGDVLFERSAKVRKFPVSAAPEFRQFVNSQAIAFLGAVDDWMEAREESAKGTRGRKCTAGVFTFAFMDKIARRGVRERSRAR